LLAVQKGQVTDFTVNGDANIRIPQLPPKTKPTNAAPVVVQETKAAPPASTKPPLIIRVGPPPDAPKPKAVEPVKEQPKVALTNAPAVAVVAPAVTNKPPEAAKIVITNSVAATNALVPVTAVPTPKPAPPVVKAPVVTNATATITSAPIAIVSKPVVPNPAPAIVAAQPVVVVPASKLPFVLIGIVVGLAVGGSLFFVVKKTQRPKQSSLISQSMTREHLSSRASTPSSDKQADLE
jgi:hypothetical protein